MPEQPRTAVRHDQDEPHQALRELGARAHQLRAATRAADHFMALDTAEDNNTGSWLISSVLALADDVATDLDGMARALKEKPSDAALQQTVAALRVRAHQLHAAARAADHFLDLDTSDGRDTGGWLVATALSLAQKLSSEIDDSVLPQRRAVINKAAIEPHDATQARRMTAATTPLAGQRA